MLIVKGGRVIDPESGFDGVADILVRDGRIVRLVSRADGTAADPEGIVAGETVKTAGETWHGTDCSEPESECCEVIDAGGMVVAPGFIDIHSHFRDPGLTYKEDIHTGAAAAAAGGYTTVVLMANTKPVCDNAETLRYVLEKGRQTPIHVESCAAVTAGFKGLELTDMEGLLKEGACGFTDDGIPLRDGNMAKKAMLEAARLDTLLSFHEEDPAFIENNGINRGEASKHYGLGGSDRQAEISMIKRDIELAGVTGAAINIQHISSREGVELVRQGKKNGVRVYAEACPHHFSLNERAAIEYGTLAKMNPPLREEEDRLAIIEGLRDGTIDVIATDHAPHSKEEKDREITAAPSGIIGLETALPLAIMKLGDEAGLPLSDILAKLTINPARMYGFDRGYIREKGPADLVIFDPGEEYEYTATASKASNSPFLGQRLKGRVRYTICGGRVVYTAP